MGSVYDQSSHLSKKVYFGVSYPSSHSIVQAVWCLKCVLWRRYSRCSRPYIRGASDILIHSLVAKQFDKAACADQYCSMTGSMPAWPALSILWYSFDIAFNAQGCALSYGIQWADCTRRISKTLLCNFGEFRFHIWLVLSEDETLPPPSPEEIISRYALEQSSVNGILLVRVCIFQVFLGTAGALIVGALPFLNKTVRDREKGVADMRDDKYDAVNAARDSRLSMKPRSKE